MSTEQYGHRPEGQRGLPEEPSQAIPIKILDYQKPSSCQELASQEESEGCGDVRCVLIQGDHPEGGIL